MTTIQQNATRLQKWFDTNSVSPGSANKTQIGAAAKELQLTPTDLQAARRFLVDQAVVQNARGEGAGAAGVTGRGQQATNLAHGGGRIDQSAAIVARGQTGTDPKLAAFETSTYTILDAKKTMEKLGLPSLDAAKKHIGGLVAQGRDSELHAIGVHPDNYDSYECKDAFSRSSYTTADAKAALAKLPFLSSLADAKEYIGLKIINGPDYEKSVLGDIGITRNNFDAHDCLAAFAKSTYSSSDVRAAKKAFDFLANSTNAEVKEYIGLKIVNGYETMLADAGITPAKWDDHELMAAFKKSAYTKADVDTARSTFDFLAGKSDKDVKEYIGLKIVNGYEEMLSEKGITQNKFDTHDCLAAFEKSGYDAGDVKMAKEQFDFLRGAPDKDVKEYIGLKIVNKYESMLSDVGIVPDGGPAASHIMSQQEMNQAAYASLEGSKGKLQKNVAELSANLDGPTKKDLTKAMKAFDKYVGLQGTFAGNQEARGGSLAPLVNAGEQKRLVDQLNKEVGRAGDQGYFNYQGTGKAPDSAGQQQMNMAAYEAFDKADKKMNALVDKLVKRLESDDPEGVKELKDTQKAFTEFRDAQATLSGNMEARGGSLFGLIHASSMEALTAQRIKLLEALG